ncbi:MAG: nucleotidyltransferase family protein [Hyphomonadaceae bacterium]|nr:nucleotidyltransferase family protein [Hyphomonadaceae bacterium]
MVFAAGLGTRMQPLTNDRPKALVEVASRTLVDHMLDQLAGGWCEYCCGQYLSFAQKLVDHLQKRLNRPPELIIVREDHLAEPLETEGGLVHALHHFPDGPIFTCNADAIWLEDTALSRLANAYDPNEMDGLLLLAHMDESLGFHGKGDFFMDEAGRLTRRGDANSAPFAYAGVQITDSRLFQGRTPTKRSMNKDWFENWAPKGRLFGLVLEGPWLHVGDPKARDDAEAFLLKHGTL